MPSPQASQERPGIVVVLFPETAILAIVFAHFQDTSGNVEIFCLKLPNTRQISNLYYLKYYNYGRLRFAFDL